MKKVTYCGLSQKLSHESKKDHKQNVYQIEFYVCSQRKKSFFFESRMTPLKGFAIFKTFVIVFINAWKRMYLFALQLTGFIARAFN